MAAVCLQSELELALAPCNVRATLGYTEGVSVDIDISLSRNDDGSHTQTAWGVTLSDYHAYEPNNLYDIFHDQHLLVCLDTTLYSEFTVSDYLLGENSRIDLINEAVTADKRRDKRFLNKANASLHEK